MSLLMLALVVAMGPFGFLVAGLTLGLTGVSEDGCETWTVESYLLERQSEYIGTTDFTGGRETLDL